MPLKNFFSLSVRSAERLPPEEVLLERARRVAEQLVRLRSAPLVEEYAGPVLFEGTAAAQVMRTVLGGNLSGAPPPDSENPQLARIFASDSALATRLGKRVLPEGWRVEDDPGLERLGDRDLLGAYRVDDEGIPARKLVLVEDGVLKTLLMSRAPRKEIQKSNGHGRAGLMAGPRPLPGNLIISPDRGLSAKRLRARLLQEAKGAGEAQPLVVTLLDEPGITGVDPLEAAAMMRDMFGGAGEALPAPLLAYRLDKKGKLELVRGARLKPVSIRVLKEISAAGKDANVLNYAAAPAAGLSTFISSAESSLTAVPASVVSPSLLFGEIEIGKATGPFQTLPLLSRPAAP
jgi:predicted Zn-dependent protease